MGRNIPWSDNLQCKVIDFTTATSETDTGWDLPDHAIVEDVMVYVDTNESGKTLDVGTYSSESGGDADGFLDGISLATAGWVLPGATLTTGSSETYFSASTYGALLAHYVAGSDAATDHGVFARQNYSTASQTAKSVTYTGVGTPTDVAGSIYIFYRILPT